jgi:glycosyltransferase involved in cell wall biosynthesis
MTRRVCFFAHVESLDALQRFEFYAQDIRILEELGFEVHLATKLSELRQAHLFFVWWWTWAFFPTLFAKIAGRPVVITGTFDHWSFYSRPKLHQSLIRFALKHADANIFVSRLEWNQVTTDFPVTRPYYVPHVVDSDVYRPNGDSREDIVFSLGWLKKENSQRKGMPDIVRAAPLICRYHPNVRFVIAGKKSDGYPELCKLTSDLSVSHSFEFLGEISREEKIRWMQRCKVYLQPSRYEGFGLAMLEAMSCGAPVVSRPVGAVPEVVGDAGCLVEDNAPEAIAGAVNRLLDEPLLLKECSVRSRKRAVDHFSFDRRKAALKAIIDELVPRN